MSGKLIRCCHSKNFGRVIRFNSAELGQKLLFVGSKIELKTQRGPLEASRRSDATPLDAHAHATQPGGGEQEVSTWSCAAGWPGTWNRFAAEL